MSSTSANKPLELDAVMRSLRPHVKTPDQTPAPAVSAAPVAEPVEPAAVEPIDPAPVARKPRKPEKSDHRVQVDVIPAAGEATVGVYLRLPKSVHQQLKTVVFQNELTEQGHQSIADITREAITDWLNRNRNRAA
jgi:hypothetical protein